MKKVIIFLIIIFLACGCGNDRPKREAKKKTNTTKTKEINTNKYIDNNTTPIAFYKLEGNNLKKIDSISNNYQAMDDITLLQVYPSNEEMITLSKDFGSSFYETWSGYNTNNKIKIGFSLNYFIGNEEVYYPILSPNNTMDYWEYFMIYLYDDYANRGKGFYSHIENDQYNDNTLFTAFKLQCGGNCPTITKPVSLSVFTYDGEDDFLDGKYRGNSITTIPICLKGVC